MKIVCDANVLISGVLFDGPPRRILSLAARGSLENVTSPALLREAEDVLLRPKFKLAPSQVFGILALFRDALEIVEPTIRVSAVADDPDDNIVLEAASTASASAIISGDHHLLALKSWSGIPVLTPAQFLSNWKD
jgi:uncharacterized protein